MQKVVRVYYKSDPYCSDTNIRQFNKLLESGWKIISIIPFEDGVNDYVIEKNESFEYNIDKIEKFLIDIGVQIKNSDGSYRNFHDVMYEISNKWSALKS